MPNTTPRADNLARRSAAASVMEKPSWQRQAAALLALLTLIIAVAVVVVALIENLAALSLGLPGLALLAFGAWWAITEVGARRILAVLAQ